jgi:hypothetical protein
VLEQYLYQPIEAQGPEYFADDAIEARGREAALSLGADPLVEVSEASAVAIDIVRTNPPETTLGSPLGTVTLAQYVPSRTAELTIHTLDIVGAIGSSLEAPSAAVADSLAFVAGRARGATAQSLLLALTGRCELPPGFSLYSR